MEDLDKVAGGINLQDLSVDKFLQEHQELLAITQKQGLAQELLKMNIHELQQS